MIVKRLKTLIKMYPKYELVFTGHSMGGAVASMAAIDALYPKGYLRPLISPSRVSVITVGQPRLGNKPFTRLFNSVGFKRVLRAVNYTDPVPHLPGMILGYRHSLREIFLDEFGVARFCNDPMTGGEDTNCAGLITHNFYNTTYHKWYFGVGLGIYSDCYYKD
jgi:hypothetical protein